MNKLEAFYNEFHEKFTTPHPEREGEFLESIRWPAFYKIAEILSAIDGPIFIAETGCVRNPDNWLGDGQSTRLWSWMVEQWGGAAISADLDPQSVQVARMLCSKVHVMNYDSLQLLSAPNVGIERIDLLYLDSFDYCAPYKELSMLHHAAELRLAYPRLKSGCLVAVDDCHSDTEGKHVFVKAFFDRLEIAPVYKGYISVWRKP